MRDEFCGENFDYLDELMDEKLEIREEFEQLFKVEFPSSPG